MKIITKLIEILFNWLNGPESYGKSIELLEASKRMPDHYTIDGKRLVEVETEFNIPIKAMGHKDTQILNASWHIMRNIHSKGLFEVEESPNLNDTIPSRKIKVKLWVKNPNK